MTYVQRNALPLRFAYIAQGVAHAQEGIIFPEFYKLAITLIFSITLFMKPVRWCLLPEIFLRKFLDRSRELCDGDDISHKNSVCLSRY